MSVHKVVCFGDSITQGYMVPEHCSYPSVLSAILGVPCVNLGVSGDTALDALGRIHRLDAEIHTSSKAAVVIEFGINDFFAGFSASRFGANLAEIVKRVKAAGKIPVLVGFEMDYPGLKPWLDVYRQTANRFFVPLFPNVFLGLSRDEGDFLQDGLHPSVSGYQKIAKNLASFLIAEKIVAAESHVGEPG